LKSRNVVKNNLAKNIVRIDAHLFPTPPAADSAAFWTVWTFGARPALLKLFFSRIAPQTPAHHRNARTPTNRMLSPRQQFSCAMLDQRISPLHAGFIAHPRRDLHYSGLNKQFPPARRVQTI